MSVEIHRRAVERHRKELARLQKEKSNEAAKAADATSRSHSAAEAAGRSSSASIIKSKMSEAKRHRDKAIRHEKKVSDLEAKMAREQGRLNDAEQRLNRALNQEESRRLRERERSDRERERRLTEIGDRLTEHDHLHHVALAAIKKLDHLPKRITVLFLAANPIDQQQLRLDEEVRAIDEMIRKSRFRDVVKLESRWALRPLDLLQAINECQPTAVHFSGHGSHREELVLQDDAGNTKLISKDAIVQTMAAASGDIQLVFFNTCYSRGQAEAVTAYVPAAIGMDTSIGDKAARVFAAQFYSSIGFGLSVETAFEQAKAALLLEGIPEELTPEIFVTEGLAADALVLVERPEQAEAQ